MSIKRVRDERNVTKPGWKGHHFKFMAVPFSSLKVFIRHRVPLTRSISLQYSNSNKIINLLFDWRFICAIYS